MQYEIRLNLGGNAKAELLQIEQILDRIRAKANTPIIVNGGGRAIGGTATAAATARGGGSYSGWTGRSSSPYLYGTNTSRSSSSSVGGRGGVARDAAGFVYPSVLPPRYRGVVDRFYSMRQGRGNWVSQQSFYKRFGEMFQSRNRLTNEWTRNMFTISGWFRNIGNMVGTVTSFGKALGAITPILETLRIGLKAYAVTWAAPKLIGGAAYSIGSRVLSGGAIGTAISDRMQQEAAQRGLSTMFARAYKDASTIAATYGLQRPSVLGNINVLNGLQTASGAVSYQDVLTMTKASALISSSGNVSPDRVMQNLQQILSANNPNARDIKELLHQAPILRRYALEAGTRQGQTNVDPQEYLKNTRNLIDALTRLTEEFRMPRTAEIRGNLELNRRSFWMQTEESLAHLWEDIGEAQARLYQVLGEGIKKFAERYDSNQMRRLFDIFIDGVDSIMTALPSVVNWLGKFAETLDDVRLYLETLFALVNGPKMVREGIGSWWDNVKEKWNAPGERNQNSQYRDYGRDSVYPEFLRRLIDETVEGYRLSTNNPNVLSDASEYERFRQGLIQELSTDYGRKVDWTQWGGRGYYQNYLYSPWANDRSMPAANVPGVSVLAPNYNQIVAEIRQRLLEALGINPNGAVGVDTENIEDLTKGSKALIINFNAPLVEMPNTFHTAANTEEIIEVLQSEIDDMVSRGFHIALNNASNML